MTPLSIRIRNFLSIKTLQFDFPEGIWLIDGFDVDRQRYCAAGKSAFMNALCLALFDEIPTGDDSYRLEEVVNDDATEPMEVEFVFRVRDREIKVTRTRFKKDASFGFSVNGEPDTGDQKGRQTRLEKLLGFNYKQFLAVAYLSQKDKTRFIDLSNTEKKRFLSSILDLSVFDRAYALSKQDNDSAHTKAEHLAGQIEQTRSQMALRLKEIETIQLERQAHLSQIETDRARLTKENESYQRAMADIRVAIDEGHREWKAKQDQLRSELVKQEDLERLLRGQLDDARIRLDADRVLIRTDMARVQQEISGIAKNTENERKRLQECLAVEQQRRSSLQQKEAGFCKAADMLSANRAEQGVLRGRLAEIDALLGRPRDQTTCEMCGQPITDQHQIRHDERLRADRTTAESKLTELISKEKTLQSIMDERPQLQSELDQCQGLIGSWNEQIKQLDGNDRVTAYQTELRLLDGKLSQVPSELIQLERDIAACVTAIGRLSQQLREPDRADAELIPRLNDLERRIERNNISIEQLGQRGIIYEDRLGRAREDHARLEASLKDACSEQDRAVLEIAITAQCKEIFSPAGVRSFIFGTMIQQLNERIDYYLDMLWDGTIKFRYSLDDNGDFSGYAEYGGKRRNIALVSGGERKSISLAVDVALMDIVRDRAGSFPELLFVDEGLEWLDTPGKQTVMEFFKEILPQRGRIYVIDHSSEFKTSFHQVIRMIKDKNETRLER